MKSIRSWHQLAVAASVLVIAASLPAQPPATGNTPSSASSATTPSDSERPKVMVIATGGTIAGVQDAPGTLAGYRAGTLTAEQIIASVPELTRFARIETEQFSNVASGFITPVMWVKLSRRINEVLNRPDIAGVVVTHGTDRLEETSFFLYLTIRSDKPVVVVGAQRPATGISPDGPINLLSAVRTAASPRAVNKGVLVVMDDRILSAREARKFYQRTGGFSTGDMGMLGVVASSGPEFFFAPARRFGPQSEFDLSGIDSLPRVELTFSYPGGTGHNFDPLPDGLVVASTGMTREESEFYRAMRQKGVVMVTVFTSGENVNGGGTRDAPPLPSIKMTGAQGTAPGTVQPPGAGGSTGGPSQMQGPVSSTALHLTPTKARILLMLALTRTRDPRQIQRFYDEY